jgi:hypothetical protein
MRVNGGGFIPMQFTVNRIPNTFQPHGVWPADDLNAYIGYPRHAFRGQAIVLPGYQLRR